MAVQVLVKKGAVVVAVTEPAKPMLHVQPEGTLVPEVGEGQATAWQDGVEDHCPAEAVLAPHVMVVAEEAI